MSRFRKVVLPDFSSPSSTTLQFLGEEEVVVVVNEFARLAPPPTVCDDWAEGDVGGEAKVNDNDCAFVPPLLLLLPRGANRWDSVRKRREVVDALVTLGGGKETAAEAVDDDSALECCNPLLDLPPGGVAAAPGLATKDLRKSTISSRVDLVRSVLFPPVELICRSSLSVRRSLAERKDATAGSGYVVVVVMTNGGV